jgi:hypothetical protein
MTAGIELPHVQLTFVTSGFITDPVYTKAKYNAHCELSGRRKYSVFVSEATVLCVTYMIEVQLSNVRN